MTAFRTGFSSVLVCAVVSCTADLPKGTRFTLMPGSRTGVDFVNAIVEQDGFNVLEYEYFYNGGGVAAGDLNSDGLPELYFTANMEPDALYLNQGSFRFKDISASAGLNEERSWTTGVTMVDINSDGWLDIYVCRSGNVSAERRRNLLYVNNGDLTFTESAASYGLDLETYSNHASFFDYDHDGDLDAYILNHAIRRYSQFLVEYMRSQRDSLAGDMLLRNDDGLFVDVSAEAGIIGNPLGFGLSAVVSDINKDGWLDIYVSNDYIEDDYMYVNQGDGTFRESVRDYFTHTSYSSMGADIADVNNDLLLDVITLDMLAEDNYRQKILKGPEDHVFYANFRENGFHEQYMRNMLHIARRDGGYIEIGQLAGLSNTDWSWAPLLADFDLDGYKDVLVTNGYMRDYTNLDFLNTTLVTAYAEAQARGEVLSSVTMVHEMPQTRLQNYVFQNTGDLAFLDQTIEWGLDQRTLSNGAIVSDLDGDGDPDIVISNINQEASLYRNESLGQSLRMNFVGHSGNRSGIGTKVTVTAGNLTMYQEMIPGRGYLSSLAPELLFGLGNAQSADIEVTWPDGRHLILRNVSSGTLVLNHNDAGAPDDEEPHEEARLITPVEIPGLDVMHAEDSYSDFDREPLLPYSLSREGPALAAGDINRDGLIDLYLGGAREQAGRLLLQQLDGSFLSPVSAILQAHAEYEDVDALMLDYDKDGDLDLYVASGGGMALDTSSLYQDRLYTNIGFGQLTHEVGILPYMPYSSSAIAAHDYDLDGDLDLFIGGRWRPGLYPHAPRSYMLRNEKGASFSDITTEVSGELVSPGLVTDAIWANVTGDAKAELIIVGDWMPIRIFSVRAGERAQELTDELGLSSSNGFWRVVKASDLDGDGDLDLVGGNRGLNTQLSVSSSEPATILAADFDHNGTPDFVLGHYIQGQDYPVAARDELLGQIGVLAQRFPTYESYALATMLDVVPREWRNSALELKAFVSETQVFENEGGANLAGRPLPLLAQISMVRDIEILDVDGDTMLDLLIAGNDFGNRAQAGRLNASHGVLLSGQGKLEFEPVDPSGFVAQGDVRKVLVVETAGEELVIVARSNGPMSTFVIK